MGEGWWGERRRNGSGSYLSTRTWPRCLSVAGTHTCRNFWHSVRNLGFHGCRWWGSCFVAVETARGRSLEGMVGVGGLLRALKTMDAERFLCWLLYDMCGGMLDGRN